MTTRPDRTAVAGVERFNGIGRTNHLPYLGVVVQEWMNSFQALRHNRIAAG
ncbi:hypothetical protein I551_7527 [Mycobacterium ulcerans str. Harvey]|uniref:Uncharacterized protein n=1 Tax=Mycobacterium ulcerans str. Harvey TaxID=1299332 RepID=A0ABN0QMR4_MYCUL|nr:hypothetical protein I551_7527 [Mycobacterium ulcerans str. Harvey]